MTGIKHAISHLRNRRGIAGALVIAGTVAAVAGFGSAAGAQADTANTTVRPAATPTCPGWTLMKPPDPAINNDDLFSVAVLSASNVWAVGDDAGTNGVYRTLIEHWNGKKWSQVPSPNPGSGSNGLAGITAVSASNIWAVGDYSTSSNFASNKTLILHWNGHSWRQVASPSPGSTFDSLGMVRQVSASNIWAVGTIAGSNNEDRSLLLHWNGHSWGQVPSPNPGTHSDTIGALDVVSANSIWATEGYNNSSSGPNFSVILHWNGHSWGRSGAVLTDTDLNSVSASSATNAWVVGGDGKGLSYAARWNGHTWTRVKTPNLDAGQLINNLTAVTVLSPSSAWAVGTVQNGFSVFEGTAVEMHWNGKTWSMMTSPATGQANSALFDVQATPSVSPWAVGEYGAGNQAQRTMVLRCR
jgi:hypothetical protein